MKRFLTLKFDNPVYQDGQYMPNNDFYGTGGHQSSINNNANYDLLPGSGVDLEKFKLKQFNNLDFPANPRWALDENAIFLKGAGVKL